METPQLTQQNVWLCSRWTAVLILNEHSTEPAYTAPVIGLGAKAPSLPDVAQLMKESISAGEKIGHQCMQRANKPGPALVNFITEHKADMVVMGNRGIGALRRTFLGSVSDYVLHHAHVPVAIIPPHKSENK
ncbi:unnamed protein product [Dicrocoelium dendriticum]|nr:unnamed protein product [Dicrocoelium dendriticum]